MTHRFSRRELVHKAMILGAAGPFAALMAERLVAADLPPLDPKDSMATALGFSNDASKVDVATHPTYRPGQRCGTCAQFLGKPGDARGGCNIFTGHSVPQGGWCQVWAQKPA